MGWRDFIEKLWWIIPPVFVIFVFYPWMDYNGWGYLKLTDWAKRYYLSVVIEGLTYPFQSFYTSIQFIFMSLGYYVVIKLRPPKVLKIIIPLIFWLVGFFVMIWYGMSISSSA